MASRPEQEVFDELAMLCAEPGYIHAIASFYFRDQVVAYQETLKREDYAKLFSRDGLIRTELATLIGLMVRGPRDLTLPEPQLLQDYLDRTEALLRELHDALNEPALAEMTKAIANSDTAKRGSPFANAAVLREPIFYGAESAYPFQYRDLSVQRYARDEEWLRKQKGFSPDEARAVVAALCSFLNNKLLETLNGLKECPREKWTLLPGFQFTIADITEKSGMAAATVEAVVNAFTFSDDGNKTFTSLSEFNAANAFPVLKGEGDSRILFLYVSLVEALYDSPFYWMNSDKSYAATAMAHRGAFTEEFTAARLERVFGAAKVFRNVEIWETNSRKRRLGEVDALVVFGDRVIVVQAKSKKLTVAARKGNDLQLRADFKGAVQDACDQAVACSQYLLAKGLFFLDGAGREVRLPVQPKSVHPICVVSDHYPALSFQASQFLAFSPSDIIEHPIVCDVFFIDVVTELLETPLRFLSYLALRAQAADKIGLSHEIVALGYHLRRNLWLGDFDFMMLTDDVSVDVDIAMAARRDGIAGEQVPRGLLTELRGTAVGRLIDEIERRAEPGAVGLGLQILKFSGESNKTLSRAIEKITRDAIRDGKPHDATFSCTEESSGITFHCNSLDDSTALTMLGRYCELRKYREKASTWFGLALQPKDGAIRFGLMLDEPWEKDALFDSAVTEIQPLKPITAAGELLRGARSRYAGRNEPCPCGSGLKYKKCHLLKDVPR